MKTCWILISPDSGRYLATPGGQYAALLSVDNRASLSDVTNELKKENFHVDYAWQSGQTMRSQTGVDRWLITLPASSGGTVWMYFELKYMGDTFKSVTSHIEKCILWICGSADIKYIFEAQRVSADYQPCNPGDPVRPPEPGKKPVAPLPQPKPNSRPSSLLGPVVAVVAVTAAAASAVWYDRSHGRYLPWWSSYRGVRAR